MCLPQVTQKQRQETLDFWRRHQGWLIEQHVLDEELLMLLELTVTPESIGYGPGMIRPGRSGSCDILEKAKNANIPDDDCRWIAGLPPINQLGKDE